MNITSILEILTWALSDWAMTSDTTIRAARRHIDSEEMAISCGYDFDFLKISNSGLLTCAIRKVAEAITNPSRVADVPKMAMFNVADSETDGHLKKRYFCKGKDKTGEWN